MPGRETPLVTGEIYHVLNRGIASQTIFPNRQHFQRALKIMRYYQMTRPPLRYSYFTALQFSARQEKLKELNVKPDHLVEILCYCFMPNHFHFLLKQIADSGISIYLSKFSNSYTRYYNTRHNRIGPLLQGKFKSVLVENEAQLIHLSRYIHLNPYSSSIVKSLKDLSGYEFSSLTEYLGIDDNNFCHKDMILSYFKKRDSYRDFVFEQAYSQRELDIIKHNTLEVL